MQKVSPKVITFYICTHVLYQFHFTGENYSCQAMSSNALMTHEKLHCMLGRINPKDWLTNENFRTKLRRHSRSSDMINTGQSLVARPHKFIFNNSVFGKIYTIFLTYNPYFCNYFSIQIVYKNELVLCIIVDNLLSRLEFHLTLPVLWKVKSNLVKGINTTLP